MPWDIGGPSSGGSGSGFDKAAHEGHRILCIHAESKPDTQTQYGTSDAVLCRYVACIDDDHVSVDAMLFGVALVPRIVEAAESGRKVVLGRLARRNREAGTVGGVALRVSRRRRSRTRGEMARRARGRDAERPVRDRHSFTQARDTRGRWLVLTRGVDAQSLSRWFRDALGTGALVRVRDDPDPERRVPFEPRWPYESKREPELWEAKLDGWPSHLLFLPTGKLPYRENLWLLVVDADLYKAGAEESLAELYALGLPRRAPTALTKRGGEHLYYFVREPIPSRALPGFPGIDVKCVGGGVRLYEWEYGWSPDEIEPPELGGIVLSLFRGETQSRPAGDLALALESREPSLVDRDALHVLVTHAGGHSPRWSGRGYVLDAAREDARDLRDSRSDLSRRYARLYELVAEPPERLVHASRALL